MRVTNEQSRRIYKAALVAKKKHKAPSLTEKEFNEYNNMVNVLNTIGRDESEICGFNLDRYKTPTVLGDMITPTEISWSGDKDGNDILSEEYKTYNPWDAGYVERKVWEETLTKCKMDEETNFVDMVKEGKPRLQHVGKFRVWLTPDEFNTLGSLILGTFKASTADDKFTTIDTYKDFGSMETYKDRLTGFEDKVRRTTTDFFPIDTNFNLYRDNQYLYDKEETLVDWYKSVCDIIISGN